MINNMNWRSFHTSQNIMQKQQVALWLLVILKLQQWHKFQLLKCKYIGFANAIYELATTFVLA